MDLSKFLKLTKRQKFVFIVILLSGGLFGAQFFSGINLLLIALCLALVTTIFLYFILKDDIRRVFYYPIFILPFLYTFSFTLFSLLIPPRFLSKFLITIVFSFGLYSLLLTQNILAVSSIRTISLLRSARIVSFVLTLFVLFFLINIIFTLRMPMYSMPFAVGSIFFLMSFQSLYAYSLDKSLLKDTCINAAFLFLAAVELSYILIIWPVNAAIFSIFLTGIFYMYSGLAHAWYEKRLFKSVLWEYIWVGFLSVLILVVFSKWGIL